MAYQRKTDRWQKVMKHVTLRLPEELWKQIFFYSANNSMSTSQGMRKLLEAGLKKLKS